MLMWHEDWTKGIHPVALGRAPWVPSPFVQAMHFIGAVVSRCQRERYEEGRG